MIRSAIGNSFRSRIRTLFTVVAIFIGAFTLTLTTGTGTGMNRYIDTTLAAVGTTDVLTVSRVDTAEDSAPEPFESGRASTGDEVLTADDLKTLARIDGVLSVQPVLPVQTDWFRYDDGEAYRGRLGTFIAGMQLDLAAGRQLDPDSPSYQVVIPESFVDPLGIGSVRQALGSTITIAVTDPTGEQRTVDARVVGVSQRGIVGGTRVTPNAALEQALFDLQTEGYSAEAKERYLSATVRFDAASTPAQVAALKASVEDEGFYARTVEDQIGSFRAVIDTIVFVLNGFAVIALLSAALGIVNTLLMSVQERTREIGLMKAMGMPGRTVFGLFSLEALFIGFLGSLFGVGTGIVVGEYISAKLSAGLLSRLPGLTLVDFDYVSVAAVVLVVMAVAFLAGTIPALRAARKDPIESLRYE